MNHTQVLFRSQAREKIADGVLEERLARLSGGVAVIRVGASSEAEMKCRKEAPEDAEGDERTGL